MNNITLQLHCGACGEHFDNCTELNLHIQYCPAAIVLLPLVHKSAFNHIMGHPYSGWVIYAERSRDLMRQYARAISNDLDNLARSRLHIALCESLHIDYNSFKPFEATSIKTLPSYEEALKILWFAFEKVIDISVNDYCNKIGFTGYH